MRSVHAMRSVHDVGGLDFGAVPLHDHEMEPWEKRSNAVADALRQKHLATLDEQRRRVESLGDRVGTRLPDAPKGDPP